MQLNIDEMLARRLIAAQFPQWGNLPIRSVEISGWDNRTFHLGKINAIPS
jgi:aminoglycoside phosphotransferase (APT) family kinase protein